MNNVFSWFTRKAEPVPRPAELRGMKRGEAEKLLRKRYGLSRSAASHYYFANKEQIRAN